MPVTRTGLTVTALAVAAGIAAVAFGFAQSGGGGAMGGMAMGGMDMGGMDMGDAKSPSSKAYGEVMSTMMANIMVPYTGDADVNFARGMIPHHQAAIEMAKIQLEFGKDPELRKLAEAVIAAQEAEIAKMKAWLAARGV